MSGTFTNFTREKRSFSSKWEVLEKKMWSEFCKPYLDFFDCTDEYGWGDALQEV